MAAQIHGMPLSIRYAVSKACCVPNRKGMRKWRSLWAYVCSEESSESWKGCEICSTLFVENYRNPRKMERWESCDAGVCLAISPRCVKDN